MVRTPHRYVPLERRAFGDDQVDEERRNGASPLRVHFLDYKDGDESFSEREKVARMTLEDRPTSNLSSNKTLSIVPPPSPRIGNDLYLQFSSHLDRFDRNWRDDPFWRDLVSSFDVLTIIYLNS